MKKLRRAWNSLPKLPRLILNILGILALIFLLYTFISAPAFTTEIQYRREEKANFVGPAEILGIEELSFSDYDRILLADDGEGVILYATSTEMLHEPELIYREKTGDITVLSAPNPDPFQENDKERIVTIFAFDSFPDAVRAELELTLYATFRGEYFEKTYALKSDRESAGYFRFKLHELKPNGLGAEGYAMQILTMISGYVGRGYIDVVFPATVRLYDANDQLICQQTVEIRSGEAQAHIERGDPIQ